MWARTRATIALLVITIALSSCQIVGSQPGAITDYTPVFDAASRGDVGAVRQAIEARPQLVRKTEWGGNTLLHDAVEKRQQPVALLLLDHKADPNARNNNGFTPLHSAAQNGDIPMLALLLMHGANANRLDREGRSPRNVAIAWRHPDAAQFLAEHGARSGASHANRGL